LSIPVIEVEIGGRKRVQGFVMRLGWSRVQYVDFTDSQALAIFVCHEQAFPGCRR